MHATPIKGRRRGPRYLANNTLPSLGPSSKYAAQVFLGPFLYRTSLLSSLVFASILHMAPPDSPAASHDGKLNPLDKQASDLEHQATVLEASEGRPAKGWRSWYQSPLFQVFLVSFTCFCCPVSFFLPVHAPLFETLGPRHAHAPSPIHSPSYP